MRHLLIREPDFLLTRHGAATDGALTHGLGHTAWKVCTLARGEGSRLDGEDPGRSLSVHSLGPLAGGDGGLGGGDWICQSGSKYTRLVNQCD